MTPPNVLVLLADQMRADVLGVNGSTTCRTPNMDELASAGANVAQAFTTTPLCSPARAALFTGRYPHSTGLIANTHYPDSPIPRLPGSERLLFEHLTAAGYRCGYVGKWHLNVGDEAAEAKRRGIADFFDHRAAEHLVHERLGLPQREDVGGAQKTQEVPPPLLRAAPYPEEYHHDFAIAEQAAAMLRDYRRKGLAEPNRPFMLVCSFYGPHFPLEVPEPYASLYDPDAVSKPPSFEDTFEGKPQGQRTHPLLQLAGHLSWPEWQRVIARYWAYVTFVDALIGRVLRALDELDLTDQTLVVVSSDHGEMAGHHRMFNKGPYFYEDVMRVPMVWRWPGTIRSLDQEQIGLMSLVDVLPTLLDLLNLHPMREAPPLQGISRAPNLLGNGSVGGAQEVFGETNVGDKVNPQTDARMIRTRRWKYIWRLEDTDELYDLVEDPNELRNLATAKEQRIVVEALREQLAVWMRETGDALQTHVSP